MTTKYKKLGKDETKPSDNTVYDIVWNGELDEESFYYVCPNDKCNCKMALITRNTQNGLTKYLMSNSHVKDCKYARKGTGTRTYNLSDESYVDSNSLFSDKKTGKGGTGGGPGDPHDPRKKGPDEPGPVEIIDEPHACKKLDDLVFSILESTQDEIITLHDKENNEIHIAKKDFVISKTNTENYVGKDLSGLRLLVDVRKQNFIPSIKEKGVFYRIYQTSKKLDFTETESGKKVFNSEFEDTFVKLIFSNWNLLDDFTKHFKLRDEKASSKKNYKIPVFYCDFRPIQLKDKNGNDVTVWETHVFDKSVTWVDRNYLKLL